METLGSDNNDLQFKVITGIESVVQRVTQRLQFWRGEWFLDGAQGIPYLADVLGHQADIGLAQQAITAQIRTVPDVIDVLDVEVGIDQATRTLKYSARIVTIYGDAEIQSEQSIVASIENRQNEIDRIVNLRTRWWSAGAFHNRWTASDGVSFWWAK